MEEITGQSQQEYLIASLFRLQFACKFVTSNFETQKQRKALINYFFNTLGKNYILSVHLGCKTLKVKLTIASHLQSCMLACACAHAHTRTHTEKEKFPC